MSQRGQPSTAHQYDKRDQCVHCGMYRVNVELLNHECTAEREAEADRKFEIAKREGQLQEAEHGK